eukprot:375326-Pelagomonas_calceolata.AAC.1
MAVTKGCMTVTRLHDCRKNASLLLEYMTVARLHDCRKNASLLIGYMTVARVTKQVTAQVTQQLSQELAQKMQQQVAQQQAVREDKVGPALKQTSSSHPFAFLRGVAACATPSSEGGQGVSSP